jgi:single-strand DNA-binding protein
MAGKSLNKVLLIGNLGKDPEVRYLQSGQAVANFSLATNERYQDKEGGWKERTEWHKIVFYGKTAEVCGQFLSKGNRVFIEGRIQTREWEKDGQKHWSTEIVGLNMIMLSGKGEGKGADEGGGHGGGGGGGGGGQPVKAQDDDIPF